MLIRQPVTTPSTRPVVQKSLPMLESGVEGVVPLDFMDGVMG
jgi:hypothetical protein